MTDDEKLEFLDNIVIEAWERIRCTDSSLFGHREVWEQAIEVIERCQRICAHIEAQYPSVGTLPA